MSTKIYNGGIIKTTSTKKIGEVINYLNENLNKEFKKLYYTELMDTIIKNYDKLLIDINHKNIIFKNYNFENKENFGDRENLVTIIDAYISNRFNKVSSSNNYQRDPSVDFSFWCMFIPYKNKVLLYPSCEKNEYLDILFSHKDIKKYGYWNNVDPDETCSKKEWNQRMNDWDNALGDKRLNEAGLMYEFKMNQHNYYVLDYWQENDIYTELLNYLPTYETRLKKLSFDLVVQETLKDKSLLPSNQIISEYLDLAYFLKNEEDGKKLINKKIEELKSILPEKITTDILKKTWKEL